MGHFQRLAGPAHQRLNTTVSIPAKPSLKTAALTSAALSALFVVVYGTSNWLTARRADVGTWYYAWERSIPFMPWMIVPYMSIDLFFIAAPFRCTSHAELIVFARRVAWSIVIAGAFFLAAPLQFGAPMPQPHGWTEILFTVLRGFDRPTNLFPSLHIALCIILAELYGRHATGLRRLGNRVWFGLIGLSTLLTYQHHFIDVVGGLILATFCFYLCREAPGHTPVVPNHRFGLYYGGGTVAAGALSFAFWPSGALLLWPAISMGIIAAAYFGLGPAVYRKSGGRLPWATSLVLAPCVLGQRISLWHYRRKAPPWNEVTPRVWIGAKLSGPEAREAKRLGVTAVLDLTAEFTETKEFIELAYQNIPVLDLTRVGMTQLQEAVDFIRQQERHGVVYIHCKAGYSRSAAVAGAYLLSIGQAATAAGAIGLLRQIRPSIVVRPEVWEAVREFESRFNWVETYL